MRERFRSFLAIARLRRADRGYEPCMRGGVDPAAGLQDLLDRHVPTQSLHDRADEALRASFGSSLELFFGIGEELLRGRGVVLQQKAGAGVRLERRR